MKIKVYAPLFGNSALLDDNGYLELEAGARLGDVYKKLKIPFLFRNSLLCLVNYEPGKLKQKLADGDIISFIGPLSGG
ncbi:MAG: MoaD/ThiS family protein [bacterium]|nr:MoaD/ThiS family protein [bacterium]